MKKTIITVAFASTIAGCNIGPKLPSQADPEARFLKKHTMNTKAESDQAEMTFEEFVVSWGPPGG